MYVTSGLFSLINLLFYSWINNTLKCQNEVRFVNHDFFTPEVLLHNKHNVYWVNNLQIFYVLYLKRKLESHVMQTVSAKLFWQRIIPLSSSFSLVCESIFWPSEWAGDFTQGLSDGREGTVALGRLITPDRVFYVSTLRIWRCKQQSSYLANVRD